MGKVKLPKEVAESVEKVWDDYSNLPVYLKHFVLTNWNLLQDEYYEEHEIINSYAKDNLVNYAQALVHGYEIEPTPEEELLSVYQMYENVGSAMWIPMTTEGELVCKGIKIAVYKLGYKIEGINA
ncbi:hypothetical protein EEL30_19825 [Brevibacillus laterosporus]|uniref:Uncharacterized protein n=1 Tax=Brevibacillus laterosporus TaxID=1465 RepID=A0A518VBF5_BRELA|nr:hypothetical protein EEL30_19825 [Brevibacillus laterosporus]